MSLAHPVVVGYNGSASARNALAYAAGMARRLGRPLLMVYVTSPGVYCEPLTGQVVGLLRDADSLERWLLTELDQAADATELEVHVRTRRGSPARELASIAAEFSADALVIGAPRHFWHHLVGSVPSWLARNARCPVIVVPLSWSGRGGLCRENPALRVAEVDEHRADGDADAWRDALRLLALGDHRPDLLAHVP
jgi:nucleotide-binding universal stress UspA family protein